MRRLVRPVLALLEGSARWIHVPILLLFLAYLASGITQVKSGEVAILLRFGKVVGENPALAVRPPGLLFAWPRPIDEVVRVDVKKVHELFVEEFMPAGGPPVDPTLLPATLDPERDGYLLTGDDNIVHLVARVQYQIGDPVAYALAHLDPESALRSAMAAGFVRTTAEIAVDIIFTRERERLARMAGDRAQARLDELGTGLSIVRVELLDIGPPFQVGPEFRAYMESVIERRRLEQEGLAYRAGELPRARGEAARTVANAEADRDRTIGRALGAAEAFEKIEREVSVAPDAVLSRLYRRYVEDAIAATGKRRVVEPPIGERYEGFRITVPAR